MGVGEDAAEIKGVVVADGARDLANLHIRTAQQAFRVGKAERVAVFNGAFARPLAEATVKIGDADVAHLCIFFYLFILIPFLAKRLDAAADRVVEIIVLERPRADQIQQQKQFTLCPCQIALFVCCLRRGAMKGVANALQGKLVVIVLPMREHGDVRGEQNVRALFVQKVQIEGVRVDAFAVFAVDLRVIAVALRDKHNIAAPRGERGAFVAGEEGDRTIGANEKEGACGARSVLVKRKLAALHPIFGKDVGDANVEVGVAKG